MKCVLLNTVSFAIILFVCAITTDAQTTIATIADRIQQNVKVKEKRAKKVSVDEYPSHSIIELQWRTGKNYTEASIYFDNSPQEAERVFKLRQASIASGLVTSISDYGDQAFMVTNSYMQRTGIGFVKGTVNVDVSAPNKETAESLAKQILAQLITASANRSISSSCGLDCSSSKLTPAFSNSPTRSATVAGVPTKPERRPRFDTE